MGEVCQIENCSRPRSAKGLCRSHYDHQWLRAKPERHERQKERNRKWNAANKAITQERSKKWYKENKELVLARERDRRLANPEEGNARSRIWHAANPERVSVRSHYNAIFGLRDSGYRGMPFWEEWSPHNGGSFAVGAQWVIENLGHRPDKNYQLHVVDRALGFVPGNLQWVPRDKHKQSEMIARLLLENQNLKKELGRAI